MGSWYTQKYGLKGRELKWVASHSRHLKDSLSHISHLSQFLGCMVDHYNLGSKTQIWWLAWRPTRYDFGASWYEADAHFWWCSEHFLKASSKDIQPKLSKCNPQERLAFQIFWKCQLPLIPIMELYKHTIWNWAS